MTVAFLLRDRCNQAIGILWEVASGKDLKRFLTVSLSLSVATTALHRRVLIIHTIKAHASCDIYRRFSPCGSSLLLGAGSTS